MDPFAERLQHALGDAYRIERELGGGGMSRVFVAREERLDRLVVIKVLPPETAAAMSVERFQREMRLAGSLQHPHIVSLLTAGGEGDLLWYAMPYVEGESLGARLERDGALPLPDAMRILHDVADALAYSHARNIVHRDIKPDNVLLSGRHALVADFGVAKAVREAAGKSSGMLTSIGVALGTPTYMAPEQAAADPHTDHRADLYSWGVMAYEMLAGRPPFQAPTPQAMLAAHVTQPVDPIGRYRENLPPALADLVMKALQKHPADRWQSADELLQKLELASTPSGGTSPATTMPSEAVRVEAERAVKRARPARVLGLFVLATAAVVAIIWLITRVFGLPDWVWIGSAVLMAAGLPIMLFTGRLERQRAEARATGMFRFSSEPAHHGWFTWRRATMGGVIAVGALLALTVAFAASRAFGIGPGATLFSAGKLDRSARIVLADFTSPDDSGLGGAVTEALRVDLTQSRAIRLMDPQEVAAALTRMQQPAGTALGDTLARQVALRENAQAILTGEITRLGSGYVISARVVTADSGLTLLAVRAQATSEGELIAAVNHLSQELRAKVGESLTAIRGSEPLEKVTTASLPALRYYTRGVQATKTGERDSAIALFERAVATDSTFAMAWRKLATAYFNVGSNPARQFEAATNAYRFRERLPAVERLHAEAYYYTRVDNQPAKAIATYRAILDIDSTDGPALNNLGLVLMQEGRNDEAIAVLETGLRRNPNTSMFVNLSELYLQKRDSAAHRELRRRLAEFAPGHPLGRMLPGEEALSRRDFDSVLVMVKAARARDDNNPRALNGLDYLEAGILRRRGQLRAAEQLAARMDQRSADMGDFESVVYGKLDQLFDDILLRGLPAEKIMTELRAIETSEAMARIDSAAVPHAGFAIASLMAGHPEKVASYRRRREQAAPPASRSRWEIVSWRALTAAAAGDWREAASISSAEQLRSNCTPCMAYDVAYYYDRAQMPDSARFWYTVIDTAPLIQNTASDNTLYPYTLRRIGELSEQLGDTTRALRAYSRFLELWQNADPELQPAVRAVRQRVAALREPRG